MHNPLRRPQQTRRGEETNKLRVPDHRCSISANSTTIERQYSMSTKRKNQVGEGTQTPGSHSRKKAKIQEARQIAIQVPTHVVNGMRLIILDRNLMNLSKVSSSKPPVSLDVERFADVSIYCSFDAHLPMFVRHGGLRSRRCRTQLRTPGDSCPHRNTRFSNALQSCVIQKVVAETPASPPSEGGKP